jgi:hypothetical protein
MAIAGIVVIALGFLLSMFSVGITSSMGGRLVLVLVGILLTLIGIIGMVNRAYMSKAIWRK